MSATATTLTASKLAKHRHRKRVNALALAPTGNAAAQDQADPAATLKALRAVLKPGGRLVVTDRRPRAGPGVSAQAERDRHTLSPAVAEAEITSAGFQQVARDDAFIDRPDDEPWWLMVFASPRPQLRQRALAIERGCELDRHSVLHDILMHFL